MTSELVTVPAVGRELVLTPVMSLDLAKSRMDTFQQFVAHYLEPSTDGGQDGGDYGPIPGAGKKKVLLKSGADKLCELYGLYDEYVIEAREEFETKLFYYKVTCTLRSRRDDSTVGTGLGSCSTYESKYRWRDSQRACPNCSQPAIIKGKDFKGDGLPTGWLCFAKKGGCGTKFKDGDKSIEGQVIGRVENPDIMDTVNTVLKMAKKRAKIDAVIGVTRSSGIFTQDLEDVPMPEKPAVKTTTEDIEIGGGYPSVVSDDAQARAKSNDNQGTPNIPIVGANCIDEGQSANFHREFRMALPKKLQKDAEEICHEYLRQQGIKDALGKPSALAIKKESFFDVRESAVSYAKAYTI